MYVYIGLVSPSYNYILLYKYILKPHLQQMILNAVSFFFWFHSKFVLNNNVNRDFIIKILTNEAPSLVY